MYTHCHMYACIHTHTHIHTHTQDLLNLEPESSFEEKFFLFRSTVRPLERRLAAALKHIFDHCPTLMAELRVLEMFQGVCRRETMKVRAETSDTQQGTYPKH